MFSQFVGVVPSQVPHVGVREVKSQRQESTSRVLKITFLIVQGEVTEAGVTSACYETGNKNSQGQKLEEKKGTTYFQDLTLLEAVEEVEAAATRLGHDLAGKGYYLAYCNMKTQEATKKGELTLFTEHRSIAMLTHDEFDNKFAK